MVRTRSGNQYGSALVSRTSSNISPWRAAAGTLAAAVSGHLLNRQRNINVARRLFGSSPNYNYRSPSAHRSRRARRRMQYSGNPTSYRFLKRKISRRMKYGRLNRRRRSVRAGGLSKLLWRRLCTPQTIKENVAFNREGNLGCNQFFGMPLGGVTSVKACAAKRPSNFLFNTAKTTSDTATLQEYAKDNWTMKVTRWFQKFWIQNRSNASMELKIYVCHYRRNQNLASMDSSPTGPIGLFEFDDEAGTYVGDRVLGPDQAAKPTGVTKHWQHPGFTPFDSPRWCQYMKVEKTHSYVLQPNEILRTSFSCPPKLFKGSWINSPGALEHQGRFSRYLLFQWIGMPVDNGTTSAQSRAVCDLFIQREGFYSFYFLPGRDRLVNYVYAEDLIDGTTSKYTYTTPSPDFVVPASETVQVISGTASVGDTCPITHP